ncbi:MAG: flagellar hook-basal body complex protein [Oscillospiraceae bacterium]|nr:flagellar hook-basal body complex protein [Oscillospiraceae bacterium]
MMRSMFSGVSGLRNHQIKMDVIGNNIANVNTYGFKASRANFADMFNQTLSGATAPGGVTGGTNPRQIGLGVQGSGIDTIFTEAAAMRTDRALDLAVAGEGFFIATKGDLLVDDGVPDEYYLTRSGNFYLDSKGYLVDGGGNYILGALFAEYFDDIGEYGASAEWVDAIGEDASLRSSEIANLEAYREYIGDIDFSDGSYPYYPDTAEDEPMSSLVTGAGDVGALGRIVIPPTFRNLSIGENGVITAQDQAGNTINIGVLATATVMNPGGLEKVGGNLYRTTGNSGEMGLGFPELGPNGGLVPGALEMSNVDLSKEFTDMIITQRGFQSNSRIITVSDTMLEELINLKR